MTARPLVSICIPVFNGLPFLKEVMETALAQDYDNYEVVVSLDPSSDGSTEFCQALADPRLRIVTNPRPGLFPNLNNAIRESRGLLVQIMGQDDRMAPGYIASQVAEFERWGDLAMVVGRDCRIDENGTVGEVSRSSDDHEPMSLPLFMWRSAHYGSMAANISCVMVARSALAEVGLFDESYRFAGDVEFYNRIATVGRISYVKESHVFIRSHRRQASRSVAANLVYMREEKRIYDGFWKSALASEALYAEVIKFRKKTRGAYHFRTAFHRMKTGRIADGAKILLSTIRYYGLFYPARHGLVRRPGVEPAFPSETIRLGDVKAAARTAAAAGEVSWLTSS